MIHALSLFLSLSAPAFATNANDFLRDYARLSSFEATLAADEICDELMHAPINDYVARLRSLGAAYASAPAAVDALTTQCNTTWMSDNWDVRAATPHTTTSDRAAYETLTLTGASLPLRIIAFSKAGLSGPEQKRPAPFEVLYALAALPEQYDAEMIQRTKQAQLLWFSVGSAIGAEVLQGIRAWTVAGGGWSTLARRSVIGSVLFMAANLGASFGQYVQQELGFTKALRVRLNRLGQYGPQALLLDDFVRATDRLAYFYNIDVYRRMDDQRNDIPDANSTCLEELRSFFAAPEQAGWGERFQMGSLCKDAAAIWAGASQHLSSRFPGQPEARRAAQRLMEKAKLTYLWHEQAFARNGRCTYVSDGLFLPPRRVCEVPRT